MNKVTSEKVIDWATLMDVCGDESVIKEIVTISIKDVDEAMGLLAEAIETGNSADVALYAHRLKGVAMTMGAHLLSEGAYQLECAGNKEDMAAAVTLIEQVKEEFEKVRSFLSRADWIETAKGQ